MATNAVFTHADQLAVVATHPAAPTTGGPVRVGDMCGVALTDERPAGDTTVAFTGVYTLSVKGVDGAGNSAVAVGDTVYYVDADTPALSKKATGKKFGYALEAVTSGATATIRVKLAH